MKAVRQFIRDTIVGGVLFVVPIVVILAILGKAHRIVAGLVTPLAAKLPPDFIGGLNRPGMLAVVVLVLFCFLAGLLAKTSFARRTSDKLENTILVNIPGYSMVKGMLEDVAGTVETTRTPVLARIEDAWQIGIAIERIEPGHVAVFIPGSPDPKSGSVYYLTDDRVRPLDVPMRTVLQWVKTGGKGSAPTLRGKL